MHSPKRMLLNSPIDRNPESPGLEMRIGSKTSEPLLRAITCWPPDTSRAPRIGAEDRADAADDEHRHERDGQE